MARVPLRTLLKRQQRALDRALLNVRGVKVVSVLHGGWYWSHPIRLQRRGNQRKPKPTWRVRERYQLP